MRIWRPAAAAIDTMSGAPSPLAGYGVAEDDVFGQDLAEISARVLGSRAGAARPPPSAEQSLQISREISARHQVDLNLEANAAALEDAGLVAHMSAARSRLAEQEAALARLPQREKLRTDYLAAMRRLSAAVREDEEARAAHAEMVERGHWTAAAAAELGEGKAPHGFSRLGPAPLGDPAVKEALARLGGAASAVAKGYENLLAEQGGARQALFGIRRDFEAVCDGLLDLLEACEEERRRLRETLRAVSAAAEKKTPGAP